LGVTGDAEALLVVGVAAPFRGEGQMAVKMPLNAKYMMEKIS
jgi:hypothetical protein